jgi:pyridoxamine 5'-phosphate oxidase
VLVARLEEAGARYDGKGVPRPAFWSGHRIVPDRWELWQGRPDRLHERRVFVRDGDRWRAELLYP